MVTKKIVIPRRYLKIARQKGTRGLRDKKTGQMMGRVALKSGEGDKTKEIYLAKDYDINHDGRIGKNERAGTLHGRTPKPVRADGKKRGTIRRL